MVLSKTLCPRVLLGFVWEWAWAVNRLFWDCDIAERQKAFKTQQPPNKPGPLVSRAATF